MLDEEISEFSSNFLVLNISTDPVSELQLALLRPPEDEELVIFAVKGDAKDRRVRSEGRRLLGDQLVHENLYGEV